MEYSQVIRRIKYLSSFPLLLNILLSSQDYLIGPDGKHYRMNTDVKALTSKLRAEAQSQLRSDIHLNGNEYELSWPDRGDIVNFGFSTHESGEGDSMAIWMIPLAKCIVKGIFLYNINFEGVFEFYLNKSRYHGEISTAACADANGWVGYYADSTGNPTTPGLGATWVSGDNECYSKPPMGKEIWPGFVMDASSHSIELDSISSFDWTELDFASTVGVSDTIDFSFFIKAYVRRTGGWGIGAWNNAVTPYHAFKYYKDLGTSGNPGWHIRSYGWMVYAMVEYYEDIPPFITVLPPPFPLQIERRFCATIVDENPTGGPAGVAEAWLFWEVSGEIDSIQMDLEEDSIYCAKLPSTDPIAGVTWWIGAVDVNGNWSYSDQRSYSIWVPQSPILILLDGLLSTGYPGMYYFYDNYGWWNQWWHIPPRDIWDWGPATLDLLDNYDTVIEITTKGPVAGNTVTIKAWLDEGGKNYILAGDEVVGGWFDWPGKPVDIDTVSDEYGVQSVPFFQYLGIETYYGDINYAEEGDHELSWPIYPVEGDVISGALYNAFEAMLPDTAALLYDPYYEIDVSNWLDGFEVDETVMIAFTAQPNPDSDYEVDTLAIGFYKEDESLNNKVMFLGFDPLSINSDPYIWWGATPYSPLVQSLDWMGVFDLALDDELDQAPNEFELNQNYPNPFNPTTTIQYDLPRSSHVSLTIYDLLGREVEVAVNRWQEAGRYKVVWDATDIPTGIYFVRMVSGEFSQVRKVMVLK